VKFAIVAAHPDDEVLGAALLLPALGASLAVIYLTDGAPRSGEDARNAGCPTWQDYAQLRERESRAALAAAGAGNAAVFRLNCPDQQATHRIAENVADLIAIFDQIRPLFVLTHSYEGGHPDHDAAAASVHAAAWLHEQRLRIIEFAGYHAAEGGIERECFRDDRTIVLERPLSEQQSLWKRRILNLYASQADVLSQFPLKNEPLRMAPAYNFAVSPHQGTLYYERFPWGVTPSRWRDLARSAFESMGVPCVC